MRIRRRAQISQLVIDTASSLKSPGATLLLQPYICQLNQSPWDVMTFSPPPSPPPPHPSFQVNGANASGGNGVSDYRISVSEREIQMNGNTDVMAVRDAATGGKTKMKKEASEVKKEQCCKTDGKSWRCRREAARGSSLCDHHLSLVKNYQNLAHSSTSKKPAGKSSPAETTRPSTRSSNKASLPTDSREFYYYSGFRPWWSKKRSLQSSMADDSGVSREADQKREVGLGTCSQNRNDDHEIDSEEDNEEEEESGGGNGKKKKRVRKPIKARSLKSLM